MRWLILLALVALVQCDTLTKSSTTTTTTQTTTAAPTKGDKEKRTLSSEAALHNLDFFSPNSAHIRYVTQDYLQLPATKTQQYVQIPATKAQQFAQYTEQKAQRQFIQVPEPKVQPYVQTQDPKLQQYVQAQDPKYQQYLQAQEQKAQQYVQAQDPKVQQYVQAREQEYVQAKEQQYVQVPKTNAQPVNYQVPEGKKQPQQTYTIQYVPAQHISHSVGVLPKYQQTIPVKQSPKYQFVSKAQQQATKTAAPAHNLILPQQQYTFPSFFGYQGNNFLSTPQYTSPAYSLFNTPAYQYVLPSHHHAPAQYSLQPVVMMFTLPGGHYLNTNAGQNALLSLLTTSGALGKTTPVSGQTVGTTGLHAAPATVPYLFHGQPVQYVAPLAPPVAQTPVSQLVPQTVTQRTTYSQQNVQQSAPAPAAADSSVQYRSNNPAQYQIKS